MTNRNNIYISGLFRRRTDSAADYFCRISDSKSVIFFELSFFKLLNKSSIVIVSHCVPVALRVLIIVAFRVLGYYCINEARYRRSDKISIGYAKKILHDILEYLAARASRGVILESEQQYNRYFEKKAVVISNSLLSCSVVSSHLFIEKLKFLGCDTKYLLVIRGFDFNDTVEVTLSFLRSYLNRDASLLKQYTLLLIDSSSTVNDWHDYPTGSTLKGFYTGKLPEDDYLTLLSLGAIFFGQFEGGVRSSVTIPFRIRECIVSKALIVTPSYIPLRKMLFASLNAGIGSESMASVLNLNRDVDLQLNYQQKKVACWLEQWEADISAWKYFQESVLG
jgi:hypothetical protein